MNATVQTWRRDCGACPISRRRFLAGCASCAAGALTAVASGVPAAEPAPRPKVRLVFSHHRQDAQGKQSEAGWPYLGYDHETRKRELLTRLQQQCPGVEFLPSTAYSPDDARKILQDDAAVDGYVAYMIGGWARAAETIAATGRPTLYVGDLYGASGEFLVAYAASRRHGPKVAAVTSSRFEDVAEAVRCFELLKQPGGSTDAFVTACDAARKKSTPSSQPSTCTADPLTTVDVGGCLQKLREATILAIGTQRSGLVDAIGSVFGTQVLTYEDVRPARPREPLSYPQPCGRRPRCRHPLAAAAGLSRQRAPTPPPTQRGHLPPRKVRGERR
ncbi:MAG: twin-arginine translocation signal domain-containing protein [Planctomycetota bacterium]|nr:twin-arginine translocation signal domain-containing protein [Planctomycetota bacterium]